MSSYNKFGLFTLGTNMKALFYKWMFNIGSPAHFRIPNRAFNSILQNLFFCSLEVINKFFFFKESSVWMNS